MQSLLRGNLEAAAATKTEEAAALERAAEGAREASPTKRMVGTASTARALDHDFFMEPLVRPLDMRISRLPNRRFELYGVGPEDTQLLSAAGTGRQTVRISSADGALGTLEHNVLGTSFTLRDESSTSHATVAFSLNLGFSAAPRELRVRLDSEPTVEYHNRPPVFDPTTGSFVADFELTKAVPSAKNFALVPVASGADAAAQDDADDEPALLELVKQEDDVFILRARPPLSPFQAFGISLASLKRKLAVS